ncbi:MAG: hypothetical protein E6I97_09875 [Chloroflexi bacterium]|nr:MAG: hypothetical protein E6I97_09875 [Chloroflexota bacterium]
MATGGWWFSPSRLRDLLAIIIPMIAVTNRFNRQRSHQTGSRSELIRRLETGTSARSWIIRGVAPIALPPLPLQNNDRKRERSGKRGKEEVLPIFLCYAVPLYSRQEQRRKGARTKAFCHRNPESLFERSG